MTDQPNSPQLYLIAPVGAATSTLGPMLAEVMDRFPIACLRIPGAGTEEELGRIADLAREIAHARDVAVVIEDHVQLAQRHGLDGVHLTNGARGVRHARKELGQDAIVGTFCGASRHDGMNAAEAGADYVSFGPCGATALGHGETAPLDLFQWWSEMIEIPVVAEGALTPALIGQLAPVTDFIALGAEIWSEPDPAEALGILWR
ncbi:MULTISPECIES: thiamine phosphate synthase [Paracoccus]|uniref:thiamine phosphate synthase n=1 Tax=Paracoccus TaxID=265 RepID=UPI001FB77136|nr:MULTISPECIES: thiamine phosphate synthase [Paracoccus]MCJ1899722.1 thiamine phosphate synthase [Paracoccus versutus]MDF3905073.1 thiamine phosphate synthase [Paracoccus sp. AS002]